MHLLACIPFFRYCIHARDEYFSCIHIALIQATLILCDGQQWHTLSHQFSASVLWKMNMLRKKKTLFIYLVPQWLPCYYCNVPHFYVFGVVLVFIFMTAVIAQSNILSVILCILLLFTYILERFVDPFSGLICVPAHRLTLKKDPQIQSQISPSGPSVLLQHH